jgi:hypothetical protein
MRPSIVQRLGSGVMKVLSFLYWGTAWCMILGGASGALLLVSVFLFPFLPFMGGLLFVQAAGMLQAPRNSGRDKVSKADHSGGRSSWTECAPSAV